MSNERKLFITKEQLEDLYHNQKLSTVQIAQKFNVSYVTILNRLKRFNISKRSRKESRKLALSREEVRAKLRKWNKEKILFELKNFANELGHSPTYNELEKNHRGLLEAIQRYIGTINESKKLAGLECYYEDREFWNKEKVIKQLLNLTEKLGHPPTQEEIKKEDKKLLGAFRRFGKLNELKKEIGLKISRYCLKPLPENKDKPTFELGYIIGCLMGDAFLSSAFKGIGLSVKDKDFTEYFAKQLERWSEFTPKIAFVKYKEHNKEFYAWRVQFYGLNYYNFFKEKLGFIKNDGKYVPTKLDWIYSMPEDFKKGIVKGLWDSEGYVIHSHKYNRRGIGLAMKNKEVIELFSKLCNQLGINTCKIVSNKKVFFSLILKDRMKFVDKIGITIQRKNDMIKSW